ncbi:MAG: response regulator [Spirochaetota bacterium]
MIEYFNCDIKSVKNANEFFDILENSKFDICILDLIIPSSIGGDEVIKISKSKYPNIIYVVSSGYYSNPVLSNYKEYGFDYVLKKPYDFEDIKSLLSEIKKRKN